MAPKHNGNDLDLPEGDASTQNTEHAQLGYDSYAHDIAGLPTDPHVACESSCTAVESIASHTRDARVK